MLAPSLSPCLPILRNRPKETMLIKPIVYCDKEREPVTLAKMDAPPTVAALRGLLEQHTQRKAKLISYWNFTRSRYEVLESMQLLQQPGAVERRATVIDAHESPADTPRDPPTYLAYLWVESVLLKLRPVDPVRQAAEYTELVNFVRQWTGNRYAVFEMKQAARVEYPYLTRTFDRTCAERLRDSRDHVELLYYTNNAWSIAEVLQYGFLLRSDVPVRKRGQERENSQSLGASLLDSSVVQASTARSVGDVECAVRRNSNTLEHPFIFSSTMLDPEEKKAALGQPHKLLLCEVAPGRTWPSTVPLTTGTLAYPPDGYDSLYYQADTNLDEEPPKVMKRIRTLPPVTQVRVSMSHQALPRYVLTVVAQKREEPSKGILHLPLSMPSLLRRSSRHHHHHDDKPNGDVVSPRGGTRSEQGTPLRLGRGSPLRRVQSADALAQMSSLDVPVPTQLSQPQQPAPLVTAPLPSTPSLLPQMPPDHVRGVAPAQTLPPASPPRALPVSLSPVQQPSLPPQSQPPLPLSRPVSQRGGREEPSPPRGRAPRNAKEEEDEETAEVSLRRTPPSRPSSTRRRQSSLKRVTSISSSESSSLEEIRPVPGARNGATLYGTRSSSSAATSVTNSELSPRRRLPLSPEKGRDGTSRRASTVAPYVSTQDGVLYGRARPLSMAPVQSATLRSPPQRAVSADRPTTTAPATTAGVAVGPLATRNDEGKGRPSATELLQRDRTPIRLRPHDRAIPLTQTVQQQQQRLPPSFPPPPAVPAGRPPLPSASAPMMPGGVGRGGPAPAPPPLPRGPKSAPLTSSETAALNSLRCPTHPQQIMALYCVECRELTCPYCASVGAHRGHNVEEAEEHVVGARNAMQELCHELTHWLDHFTRVEHQLQAERTESQQRHRQREQKLHGQMAELHRTIQSREETLRKQLEDYTHHLNPPVDQASEVRRKYAHALEPLEKALHALQASRPPITEPPLPMSRSPQQQHRMTLLGSLQFLRTAAPLISEAHAFFHTTDRREEEQLREAVETARAANEQAESLLQEVNTTELRRLVEMLGQPRALQAAEERRSELALSIPQILPRPTSYDDWSTTSPPRRGRGTASTDGDGRTPIRGSANGSHRNAVAVASPERHTTDSARGTSKQEARQFSLLQRCLRDLQRGHIWAIQNATRFFCPGQNKAVCSTPFRLLGVDWELRITPVPRTAATTHALMTLSKSGRESPTAGLDPGQRRAPRSIAFAGEHAVTTPPDTALHTPSLSASFAEDEDQWLGIFLFPLQHKMRLDVRVIAFSEVTWTEWKVRGWTPAFAGKGWGLFPFLKRRDLMRTDRLARDNIVKICIAPISDLY